MAMITSEEKQAGRKVLSAVNYISLVGGADATLSGNSTITAVCNAIANLPDSASSNQGEREAVIRGLKLGVLVNAYSETHGFSTIASMRSSVAGQIVPDIDSTYNKELFF